MCELMDSKNLIFYPCVCEIVRLKLYCGLAVWPITWEFVRTVDGYALLQSY